MSSSAAKLDAHSFTLFQKELHRRRGEKDANGKVSMSEGISTSFQHRFKKISWYTPIKEKLLSSKNGNEIIYTASNTYDHLMKSFLTLTLPPLRIKSKFQSKYRMCWTHNVGINININAKLQINDITLNSFDSVGHDILSQWGYLTKPGFKKLHLISIGSIPKLENWMTYLPAHQLNVLQPFYYAKASHLALPILGASLNQFKHIYLFRNKILDLLRMQRFNEKTQTWVDIPSHQGALAIDGIKDKHSVLSQPELWGRYAKITDEERDWYRQCQDVHEYYYDDLVVCDDKNTKIYGQTAEIDLKSSTPIKAIFWVNENLLSSKNNNYSNYTTNSENINLGWNPSKSYSLIYGGADRIPETSIDHAEREEAWEFPRAPWEPGYNAITFCNNPFSVDGEASLDFKDGAKLLIRLGNTDPNLINPENYENKEEVTELDLEEVELEKFSTTTDMDFSKKKSSTPEFTVRCRLLVYKKLTYYYENDKYYYKVDSLDKNQVWFDDEIKKK